ncbi:DNA-processing protein DprA [Janibacter cremeus]|uniref:DNA-processing protein DprA n=1 Tax=Janibacter cremeus TaxID=1285192 RepID=UPI0023F89162|nr:DNA-processing protein DprA [Janibacter cremeus]WEV78487.1 DNA-processing protein DprA [Janibacter cremeus]
MSAGGPRVPTRAEVARAHAEIGSDERRARIAWSRLLEPQRERVSDKPSALHEHIAALGHVDAWHRLVDDDLPRCESARARVPDVDVDGELARATRSGARVVIPGDADWPAAFDHPLIAPHLVHVRGQGCLGDLAARAVAIVGSRASSGYGEAIAREMGAGVARHGWSVVSGAAYGIDAAAHQGALAVDGPAIAVLPCGPDRVYPRGHERLIHAVAEAGVVITELATGTTARRHRFLARNRLIAALGGACVVVEAGLRSGSLNTAGWADALHRPVGAVPGPVTQMSSAGCHEWIRRGQATLVTDADEVLGLAAPVGQAPAEAVELLGPSRAPDVMPSDQRRVHDLLDVRRGRDVGALATDLVVPVEEVIGQLAMMQLEGWAHQAEDGRWHRGGGPTR